MKYRLEVTWKNEVYEQVFDNPRAVEERLLKLNTSNFIICDEDYAEAIIFLYEFKKFPSDYAMIHPRTKGNLVLEIEAEKNNKTIDELLNFT